LSKIRPLHIQDLEARALKKGRKDGTGGLSAQSVLHVHRILAEALNQAVRWRLLAVNPAAAVQPPRPERPELRIPEPAVVERIIKAAEGTGLHMPILLAAATGMRRGEILGLRWRAVDLKKGNLRVIATLQRNRRGLGFGEPKTQRGRRTIVLPPFAVDVLRRHRKEQAQKRLRLGRVWRDEDLVVTTGVGGPMDPGEVTRGFRRLAREIGVEGVRFHDLRHAYATMLLASGVHPKIASEALGHSTIGITLDTYSHVLPTMQAEAAKAVEQALGSISHPKPSGGAEGAVRSIRSKDLSE
jgi:integrase